LFSRNRFTRQLVGELLRGVKVGNGYLRPEEIERARPLFYEQIRVRFHLDARIALPEEVDAIVGTLRERGRVIVDRKAHPGSAFYFTFSSRYSVERNLDALRTFYDPSIAPGAAVAVRQTAQFAAGFDREGD
jgi:hypothetical protein